MGAVAWAGVIGELRRTMRLAGEGALPDAQLLERFVAGRDEAAFAALARRHGPMVLGVCRRVLRHHHDAEDAFQAAFLVLARKAASVRGESLAAYLYTVAYHAALEARAAACRRRRRERQVEQMPHPEVAPAEAQDWRPVLDREIHQLPAKFRAAVVLCDLEGKTRKEAARQLRLPEGTLSSRLAAARRRLARGLARHGLSVTGAALAAALAEEASAAVPAALVSSAARAAGGAGAPAAAAGLVKGVMKAMLMTRLKATLAAVVLTAALGTGGYAYRAAGEAAPADKPPPDPEALRKENELLRLNVQVLLEKVRAQENEIAALKGQVAGRPRGENRDADKENSHKSQQNLRQIALAFHNYMAAYNTFPPAASYDRGGRPLLSWRVHLLPFLEQDELYKQFHLDEPWDSDHNKALLGKMPRVYALPGKALKDPWLTPFQVFVGKDALFDGPRKPRLAEDIPDGTSNTILVVEGAEGVPWTKPEDIPLGEKDPRTQIGGWYGDFANVSLCDGSARKIDLRKMSTETLRNAITPADGQPFGPDW
jgi:RNA polymerase sigma factor (sigma-70 family)